MIGIEHKLDMLIQMFGEMKKDITELKEDVAVLKQDVDKLKKIQPIAESTREHVVTITERFTQTEKLRNIFSENTLQAADVI